MKVGLGIFDEGQLKKSVFQRLVKMLLANERWVVAMSCNGVDDFFVSPV